MRLSTVPLIPIDLDKPRHLRLGMRAHFLAEQELRRLSGDPTFSLLALMNAGTIGFTELMVLLWAGLLHEDPPLTLAQAQDLMDFSDLDTLTLKMVEAWRVGINVTVPQDDGNGQVQTSETGAPPDPSLSSPGATSGLSAASS